MISRDILTIINENPTLPVYAYVDGDVVLEPDACFRWLGKVSKAEVRWLSFVEPYGCYGSTIVDKEDYEDYYEYLINSPDYYGLNDEEADKAAMKEINDLTFHRCIILNIDTI